MKILARAKRDMLDAESGEDGVDNVFGHGNAGRTIGKEVGMGGIVRPVGIWKVL